MRYFCLLVVFFIITFTTPKTETQFVYLFSSEFGQLPGHKRDPKQFQEHDRTQKYVKSYFVHTNRRGRSLSRTITIQIHRMLQRKFNMLGSQVACRSARRRNEKKELYRQWDAVKDADI